jgi:HK97 family phage prohead protease
MAKYDHIDFTPPSGARSEAKKGLAWRREFGRGGTAIGIARARDLSNGVKISPSTARRMKAFFDRHQSDKTGEGWSPGEKGFPSNGRIAHALWGGDAGYAWSRKLVNQMKAADKRSIEKFLEDRGFCATGKGGGVDNSCSPKGSSAGAGGSDKYGDIPAGYESSPSLTGEGRINGYHGEGGPGPNGATHEVTVQQDGKGGWMTERFELGVDGATPVYDSIERQTGYKTRDEALQDAVKGLPPINPNAYKASVDGSWRPDFSKNKPNPFSRKPSRPGRPGRLPRPPKPKKRSDDLPMGVESRSLCLDDFNDADAFPLLKVERRCEQEGGEEETWLVGYAARFGVNSLKMDDFYERIDPGAFGIVTERRGRKSPLETRALFNHDPNYLLGRFPNTLRMKVDEHGLRYEIKMPHSRRDLVESIERGDIRGSSFSFVVAPGGDEWSVEEGRSIRTVKRIASLVDVGPVTFPAYPTPACRSPSGRTRSSFAAMPTAGRQVSKRLVGSLTSNRSSRAAVHEVR